MEKQSQTIVGVDFDMTVVDTFAQPRKGLGVPAAYEKTILDIFGEEAWRGIRNGYRNQAPVELGEMIRAHVGSERFVGDARAYYIEHRAELDAVMPVHNGFALNWRDGDSLNNVVEMLVRRKLQLLLPNIGQSLDDGNQWPRLMRGFDHFWQTATKRTDVVTAVISSGHDVFIERVFELYELPLPEVLISDDYMRRKGLRFYKPDPNIWECLLREVRKLGHKPTSSLYIGDSRPQDGGLALGALIRFKQFAGPGSLWHGHDGTFEEWTPELLEEWLRHDET